jgi:crotonobetainyl-CoA:carnitine CoA-transferase CaiB-like acyl-CoA transferase
MKEKVEGLLSGIVVLDLANERGSFCSKLLADLGATVIKAENPEGDPSRTIPSFFYHNANKLGITLDLQKRNGKSTFHKLIRQADVLVETFSPGYLETLDLGFKQLHRLNPRIIHLSITGFGQTGPKSAYHSCDCVHAAFGGQMHVSGAPSGKPLRLFGPQSSYAASLFGAVAVLLNLKRRRNTGRGFYIDLSHQEAVASTLGHVMIDYFHDGRTAGGRGKDPQQEMFSILRCKDGYIQIPILRNWETLTELAVSKGKAKNPTQDRWKGEAFCERHYRQIVDKLEEWTRDCTKQELFELGQAMGFPWAPVQSPEEVLRSPQLKARRFLARARFEKDKRWISVPRMPYRFSSYSTLPLKPAPRLGEHTRRIFEILSTDAPKQEAPKGEPIISDAAPGSGSILRGLRVLDLTRMLSGPYATRVFADFGAEVIKIQSRLTATGAEQNDTPGFRAWNRNKRSISLNLNRPEAREILLELVSISDVLVENYSPRVLANWGLGYERLKTVKPDLVMASISAMGQSGPMKNFVGFAPTFHALSGLIFATSRSLPAPADIGYPYGDIIAGLYAALAILASIEHRNRTGCGQYIDLSAFEAVCTVAAPALIAASRDRALQNHEQEPDDCGGGAPCGCYPCKGEDRWCVIAIFNDAEWHAFCAVTFRPELNAPEFSTPARRRKNRVRLNERVRQWTASYSPETIVRRLQQVGIAAGIVQNAGDLAKDRQLAMRRFFLPLLHPVFGKYLSERSALWPWDERPEHWKASPLLGEDNRHVLVDLLGRSDSEFQSLIKNGILD